MFDKYNFYLNTDYFDELINVNISNVLIYESGASACEVASVIL